MDYPKTKNNTNSTSKKLLVVFVSFAKSFVL